LNPPDPVRELGLLATLPRLPRDQGGPVFAEPWQATAFALAVRLSVRGCFAWQEWGEALSQELKADELRGGPADGSPYYDCWLTALERLVIEKGLCDPASLLECKEAWAEAYKRTPHGEPVELQSQSGA
jgi:nitrile hydratase accessory protein